MNRIVTLILLCIAVPLALAQSKTSPADKFRQLEEIWRRNNLQVSKTIVTPKEIKAITLDPHLETADTDLANNHWPPKPVKSRFQIFKEQRQPNPMQEQKNRTPNP